MEDRRAATRFEFSVQMEIRKNGDVFQGTSVNVSETGILIETNKLLETGTQVIIHLVLPSKKEISGTGNVVRKHEFVGGATGLAVHWELTQEQRAALAEAVTDEFEK